MSSEAFQYIKALLPIVIAVLSLIGGAAVYLWQKRIDRKSLVRARHFDVYVEMVEAVCELANAHNRAGLGKEDALSRYFTAKMKFAIVASDETMRKFVAFDKKLTSGVPVPPNEFDFLLAEFLKAVRKENLDKTNITNEELIVITPYGKSLRN